MLFLLPLLSARYEDDGARRWGATCARAAVFRGTLFAPRADGRPVGLLSLHVNDRQVFAAFGVDAHGVSGERLRDLLAARPTIHVRPGDFLYIESSRAAPEARAMLEASDG